MFQLPTNFTTTQNGSNKVEVFSISQATKAVFPEIFFRKTVLFFILRGAKRVVTSPNADLSGYEGDVFVFSPEATITMENHPVFNEDYKAIGISYSNDLVRSIFTQPVPIAERKDVLLISKNSFPTSNVIQNIQATWANDDLPQSVKVHRLAEPLVWLKEAGYNLQAPAEENAISRVRRLIETDLSHSWHTAEVADHFAMSEATFRRWLAACDQSFSKVLLRARLERALTLLQISDAKITQISLECGFKTPSHFADVFRKRFGITPKAIRHRPH